MIVRWLVLLRPWHNMTWRPRRYLPGLNQQMSDRDRADRVNRINLGEKLAENSRVTRHLSAATWASRLGDEHVVPQRLRDLILGYIAMLQQQ